MSVQFEYFYGNQAEQFAFYRIPKLLITSPEFKRVSDSAKLLYGLMLDRMSLSIKNGWVDDENRAFISFTTNDVILKIARRIAESKRLSDFFSGVIIAFAKDILDMIVRKMMNKITSKFTS